MAELKDVKGIGPKALTLLNKINICSIEDLLTHYPLDTIWAPVWIVWHKCWKLTRGTGI